MSALTRRIPRPSLALVVAFVALFAALGGTSYAALKITGKNVENSSLTGADVKNKSLKEKELEPDTLTGGRIKESTLGTVPHATNADNAVNAVNAQTAAKAADADKLGGLAPADLMLDKHRARTRRTSRSTTSPTPRRSARSPTCPAGPTSSSPGSPTTTPARSGVETCTLNVPGANDAATFTVGGGETEAISLQEVVTSDSLFMPSVNCTGDGTDDVPSGSIIAMRLD